MKILLVDDDAFLRDMYATKFGEAGHEVSVATTGLECLSAAEKETFDMILMDMIMPGMTGLELLTALQAIDNIADTKRVILSNQGEESDKKAAKEAGAVGYIIKAESIPSEVVKKAEEFYSK